MKIKLKKRTIVLLIAGLISSAYGYSSTSIDFDGGFDIPTGVNEDRWLNDSSLNQQIVDNSTYLNSSNNYIPTDANGNFIQQANVVNVIDTPMNSNVIYGGYGDHDAIDSDSALIMNTGQVSSVYGVYNYYLHYLGMPDSPSAIPITGSVYLKNDAHVNNEVYGSYRNVYYFGDITSNAISSVNGNVYLKNTVSVGANIYGAYSYPIIYSDITDINNGHISADASAIGNVYLSNNVTVGGEVYGAYVYTDVVNGNKTMSSNIANSIGNVYLSNNSVVNGNIYSTYTNLNTLASTNLDIYNFAEVSSRGNVYLRDNVIVSGEIYGTYIKNSFYVNPDDAVATFNASGNIFIYGNVKLQNDSNGITEYKSSLWGGKIVEDLNSSYNAFLGYYNVFNNNLLSIGNSALTVKTVGNFAHYNFYLNDYNKSLVVNNPDGIGGTGLLTVTDSIKNNNTVEDDGNGGKDIIQNKSTIHVAGISGVNIVNKGDSVVLIDASGANSFILGDDASSTVNDISGLFETQTGDVDTNIKVGLVGEADVRYTVDSTNNKIIATIDDLRVSKENVNLNVKPLAEGRLATLENVTRGADLLSTIMGENKPVGTFTPIAVIDGGVNKYNSGSHIDSRDYRLMVGSRYQVAESFYTGLALEYGRSNYDTYNEFNSTEIRGDGNTYNYGASLFGKYINHLELGDMYVDGAFRFGRTSTEFDSSDIVMGNGDFAHYKSRVDYSGANVGLGFIYNLDERSSFDTSVRYLWTRLGEDSVVLDGDRVNFDKAISSRIQFKEQYNYQYSNSLTFSLAGIYEYEFDGKADANISGIAVDAPSVKGSTGIVEFAVKGTPIADKDFSFNINVRGYGGKRNGASASAFIQYDF